MREILFPPLPEDPKVLDDVVDTWTVVSWKSMSKKEHGPRFMAGGVPW
jgi:ubiquitin carboxyl-terminal hydrolase 7